MDASYGVGELRVVIPSMYTEQLFDELHAMHPEMVRQ